MASVGARPKAALISGSYAASPVFHAQPNPSAYAATMTFCAAAPAERICSMAGMCDCSLTLAATTTISGARSGLFVSFSICAGVAPG